MTVQHSNYFHGWIVPLLLSGVLLLFAGGCVATTQPPLVVEVDPSGIWPAHPLTSLAEEVPSLYLPAHKLSGITLASVLWRPQPSAIPAALKLSNEALNDEHWYIEMMFGSSSPELWMYQGEGLANIKDLTSKLKDFAPSGEQLKLSINHSELQIVPIQDSTDGSTRAISFTVDEMDLLVIWQRITVPEMETFVNSLTLASQSEELVNSLEREWQ